MTKAIQRTQILSIAVAACFTAGGAFAQATQIDCEDPANAANEECLLLPLPGEDVTNFAFIAGPLIAAGAALAVLGGDRVLHPQHQ